MQHNSELENVWLRFIDHYAEDIENLDSELVTAFVTHVYHVYLSKIFSPEEILLLVFNNELKDKSRSDFISTSFDYVLTLEHLFNLKHANNFYTILIQVLSQQDLESHKDFKSYLQEKIEYKESLELITELYEIKSFILQRLGIQHLIRLEDNGSGLFDDKDGYIVFMWDSYYLSTIQEGANNFHIELYIELDGDSKIAEISINAYCPITEEYSVQASEIHAILKTIPNIRIDTEDDEKYSYELNISPYEIDGTTLLKVMNLVGY